MKIKPNQTKSGKGGGQQPLSLLPESHPPPRPTSCLSQMFRHPSNNCFFKSQLFLKHRSGSREDVYQKHLRNKPLTSHISETDTPPPPLLAPFSKLLLPSSTHQKKGPQREALLGPDLGKHLFPALRATEGCLRGQQPPSWKHFQSLTVPPRSARSQCIQPARSPPGLPSRQRGCDTADRAQRGSPPPPPSPVSCPVSCPIPSQGLTCCPQGSHHPSSCTPGGLMLNLPGDTWPHLASPGSCCLLRLRGDPLSA